MGIVESLRRSTRRSNFLADSHRGFEACEKFGGGDPWGPEHADHTRQDWRAEVEAGDTLLGYWEWVGGVIASDQ